MLPEGTQKLGSSVVEVPIASHSQLQVVIDVGINRVEDSSRPRGYRLAGDVHFEKARERASLITPVPGGRPCRGMRDLPWRKVSPHGDGKVGDVGGKCMIV